MAADKMLAFAGRMMPGLGLLMMSGGKGRIGQAEGRNQKNDKCVDRIFHHILLFPSHTAPRPPLKVDRTAPQFSTYEPSSHTSLAPRLSRAKMDQAVRQAALGTKESRTLTGVWTISSKGLAPYDFASCAAEGSP